MDTSTINLIVCDLKTFLHSHLEERNILDYKQEVHDGP